MLACPDGSVTTTNATPTDFGFWGLPDGSSCIVVFSCLARQSNGAGRCGFRQSALLSKSSGALTANSVGTQERLAATGAAAWVATLAIVSGALVARVTGESGKTIDWNVYLEFF